MNINTLNYALVLAEEGNMRKAAKRLYISQPSLSQSISRLEHEIGTPLFVREKSGIKPTQAGIFYLEWAEKVFNSQKNLLDKINAVKEGHISSIKIGTTFYRASHLLTDIFVQFLELCPGCQIILEEHSSSILPQLLENKSIDFCITPDKFDQIDYTSIPFFQEQILLAAPKQIALPFEDSKPYPTITVQSLDGIPFILLAEDLYIGKLARSLFLQLNCQPNIIMQCRTMDTALSLVQRGLATTLIPRSFFLPDTSSCIQYYQINHPAAVREISVIYRKEHYLTTEEIKFLNLLNTLHTLLSIKSQ